MVRATISKESGLNFSEAILNVNWGLLDTFPTGNNPKLTRRTFSWISTGELFLLDFAGSCNPHQMSNPEIPSSEFQTIVSSVIINTFGGAAMSHTKTNV